MNENIKSRRTGTVGDGLRTYMECVAVLNELNTVDQGAFSQRQFWLEKFILNLEEDIFKSFVPDLYIQNRLRMMKEASERRD